MIIGNKVIRGFHPDYADVEGVYLLETVHRHPNYKKYGNLADKAQEQALRSLRFLPVKKN